ncbi:MAG: S9 family peptidase [Labilithrix sp.]|nr:S9 family peptidase [Labilithrix sp.]MCW5815575.1 S9 family peptidase [Labilithrix sp.]
MRRWLGCVALAACAHEPAVVVPPVTTATPPPIDVRPSFDYPPARRTGDADTMHGRRVPDPYRWLEEDSDETKAWFEAEDQRARREIDKLDTKGLIAAMGALYQSPLPRLATKRGELVFMQRGRRLTVTKGAREDVLFEVDETRFESIASFEPSRDGAFVAVVVSSHGADMQTAAVVDVKALRPLEVVDGLEGSEIVWADKGFFYGYTPPAAAHADRWANREIRWHAVGAPRARDRVVVPATRDKDASSAMNPIAVTKDGARLLVQTFGNWSRSTYALVDLAKPSWPLTELAAAGARVESPVVVDDTVFAIVRADGGADAIARFNAGSAEAEALAAASPELLDLRVHGSTLTATRAARPGDEASGFVHRDFYDSSFTRLGSASTPRGATDWYFAYPESPTIIVTREGLGVPQRRYELDPRTGALTPFVPSKVDWDERAYDRDLLVATSKDGTKVPITVLRRIDTPVDGTAALAVYGYGGFRGNAEQIFYPPWMAWASEQGRAFATCHIRGGLEHGEPWHEAGARRNRQRTLEDFHACLEELHRRRYATPARTVTQGWSHGGMMVTAAALQRPDLQRVVLALAPLEDMIRFPLFGRGGVSEYGDPADAGDFEALLGFSPYHQIKEGVPYPAFFVTSPSKDERVHPMHPRKLVAALQHASAGREVLLKVLWDAGHRGGGKDDANATLMEGFAFALREMARP